MFSKFVIVSIIVVLTNAQNFVRAGLHFCNSTNCHFPCPDALGNECTGHYRCGTGAKHCSMYCEPDACHNVQLTSLATGRTFVNCKDEEGCKNGFTFNCGSKTAPAGHKQKSCVVQCGMKSCENVILNCIGDVESCQINGEQNFGSGNSLKHSMINCDLTNPKGKCMLNCGQIPFGQTFEHRSCDGIRFLCPGKGKCYCCGESCQYGMFPARPNAKILPCPIRYTAQGRV